MVGKNIEEFMHAIERIENKKHAESESESDKYVTKEMLELLIKEKAASLISNNYYGATVMGDQFSNISNSSIINRSEIHVGIERIRGNSGTEIASSLEEVTKLVEKHDDQAVGKTYEAFIAEAGKQEPNRSFLKSLWSGIESALPTVKSMVEISTSISKLF